jgi:membrane protease YdiL (CAAX protease family)
LTPEFSSRKRLTKLVYAALLLIATTFCFVRISLKYDYHLVQTKQFGMLQTVNEYSELTDSVFYLVQLVVILFFFRPLADIFSVPVATNSVRRSLLRNIGFGVLAGLVALLAALPSLLADNPSIFASFLINHLYGASDLALLVILIFLLPVASEVFFRGVLLRQLMEVMSVAAALVVSTLLSSSYYLTFGPIPALALGLVAGILFYRTGSVLACIIANSSFTLGGIALLLWRSM